MFEALSFSQLSTQALIPIITSRNAEPHDAAQHPNAIAPEHARAVIESIPSRLVRILQAPQRRAQARLGKGTTHRPILCAGVGIDPRRVAQANHVCGAFDPVPLAWFDFILCDHLQNVDCCFSTRG